MKRLFLALLFAASMAGHAGADCASYYAIYRIDLLIELNMQNALDPKSDEAARSRSANLSGYYLFRIHQGAKAEGLDDLQDCIHALYARFSNRLPRYLQSAASAGWAGVYFPDPVAGTTADSFNSSVAEVLAEAGRIAAVTGFLPDIVEDTPINCTPYERIFREPMASATRAVLNKDRPMDTRLYRANNTGYLLSRAYHKAAEPILSDFRQCIRIEFDQFAGALKGELRAHAETGWAGTLLVDPDYANPRNSLENLTDNYVQRGKSIAVDLGIAELKETDADKPASPGGPAIAVSDILGVWHGVETIVLDRITGETHRTAIDNTSITLEADGRYKAHSGGETEIGHWTLEGSLLTFVATTGGRAGKAFPQQASIRDGTLILVIEQTGEPIKFTWTWRR